ncbi:MAG TPA: plastocyanin/azurin family copper-binding protein [Ignavibacteriaceae bacterium]|nr:plastocyanin/azurin family copper-binding protein [Ignavibacteriaceae bacterium]
MKKFWLLIIPVFASTFLLNAQTSHIVQVSNYAFTPMNVNITVGDTVKWVWAEGSHTTTSDSTIGQNVWNADINVTSPTYSVVITEAGVHHYHCIPHQSLGMVGTITASLPTGVKNENIIASKFNLEQNYPNPFNPSTIISYTLNNPGFVSLKVYNSIGQEVATLVNENQSAGAHSIVFNTAENLNTGSLASGVYYYKLKTSGFEQTRKMLLLK